MRRSTILIFVLSACFSSFSQVPERIKAEWEMLASGSGTWIADNAAYKNENETADAYGVTWTYGIGKTSLNGRLFGIKEGKETGTFWEFRMYYHPSEKKLMYQQYGWGGTLGIAEMTLPDESHSEDVVTLHQADGTQTKIRHVNETKNNVQYAQSYAWQEGEWKKQRYYEWKKKV